MQIKKNKKLKIALIESELSQRELAKRAKLNECTLSLAIAGRLVLSYDQLCRIAGVLGQPVSELFDDQAPDQHTPAPRSHAAEAGNVCVECRSLKQADRYK